MVNWVYTTEGLVMTTMTTSPLWSVDETAAFLRLNRKTLLAWDRQNYGPTRRLLGNRAWYLADEVQAFIHSADEVPNAD